MLYFKTGVCLGEDIAGNYIYKLISKDQATAAKFAGSA